MLRIQFNQRTHVGMQRDENQDHMGHFEGPLGKLFVVCDGMGGHAGGQVASQLAVETIGECFEPMGPETDEEEALKTCVEAANNAIYQRALEDPDLQSMGTTCVALLIKEEGEEAFLAHVGDSRVYRIVDAEVERLTRDHTAVQHLIDQGLLTEEQAALHPRAHVINRSLGVLESVEVEVRSGALALKRGDRFVLCSDGLTGLVEDHEIYANLAEHSIDDISQVLVDLANSRGGYDNVTVQVVEVGEGTSLTPANAAREIPRVRHQPAKKLDLNNPNVLSPSSGAKRWNWNMILVVVAVLALAGFVVLYVYTK